MPANAERPTRLITAQGEVRVGALTDDEQVKVWGRCLHNGAPGFIEVAHAVRAPSGKLRMRSRSDPAHFPCAGDVEALAALVSSHRGAGEEVFATPLTRRERRPGKAGRVLPGRIAWVDIDEPAQLAALRAFAVRPHLVVYSGSGAHAYWKLDGPLAPDEIEAANRKLADHLGGDQSSTERARIMRVPSTRNGKADRPCRLAYCDLCRPAVEEAKLTAGLKDPDPPAPAPAPLQRRRNLASLQGDDAAQLTPPAYFRALAGVTVSGRGGHIPCPLPDHDERISSCMVYPTTSQGWRCFGCGRGNKIYDLASLLEGGSWGRALRGEEFIAVKRRVHAQLGIEATTASPPRRAQTQRNARAKQSRRPPRGTAHPQQREETTR